MDMRHAAICLAACCSLLRGQFADLVTTEDGSQLYFTSALRQQGTGQYPWGKIFRYSAAGFELFRQEQFFFGGNRSNPYALGWPEVSADGRIVAYSAVASCRGGSACICFAPLSCNVIIPGLPYPFSLSNGIVRLSGDGNFLLQFGGARCLANPPPWPVIVEIATRKSTPLTGFKVIGDGRQSITDDGAVLAADASGPALWRNGDLRRLAFSQQPILTRVNRTATRIVYESGKKGETYRLISYDVASQRETLLASAPCARDVFVNVPGALPPCYTPSLSNDGQVVLYIAAESDSGPPQVFLQSTDGNGKLQLTEEPEGIGEAILSGDGEIAYAVTRTGKLVRIDIGSASIHELTGPTPLIGSTADGQAPGSLIRLLAGNSIDAAANLRILLDQSIVPIVSISPSEIMIQIPWEILANRAALPNAPQLLVSSDSPFEQVDTVVVTEVAPQFELLTYRSQTRLAIAAHTGFDALITPESPAAPDEIIHVYMSGLGAVDPPIETGAVTPVGTIYRVQTPLLCKFRERGIDFEAEVLFAGLAPGFMGLNQVDLRVPKGLATPTPELSCSATVGMYARGDTTTLFVHP